MAQLQEFYQNQLLPYLTPLEEQRLRIVARLKRMGLICAAATVGLGAVIAFMAPNPLMAVFAVIPGGIAYVIIHLLTTRKYRSEFKDQVIGRIVKFAGPELSYRKDGFIPQGVYMSSQLFLQHPDRYSGEDLIFGRVGQTAIQFSELHTQHRTERINSKGERETQWHDIFRGIFFVADFNKHFMGSTVVLPDTAQGLLGGLIGQKLQSWNPQRDDLVKLEDVEFEKRFVVYATDQIEARYLLSTSLMERIMRYQDRTGRRIFLSFVGSFLYVAIAYDKDLFEPSIWVPVTDLKAIQEFLDDLMLGVSLVEELNLNTRIWSKQ